MGKNRPYTKLERFALKALQIMETRKEWDSDTLGDINQHAHALGLAEDDGNAYMRRTAAGKRRISRKPDKKKKK